MVGFIKRKNVAQARSAFASLYLCSARGHLPLPVPFDAPKDLSLMDCIPRAVCSNFCRVRQARFFIFPTPASMRRRRGTRHRLEYLRTSSSPMRKPTETGWRSKKGLSPPPREIRLLSRRNSRKRLQFATIKCGTIMPIPLLLLNGRVGK